MKSFITKTEQLTISSWFKDITVTKNCIIIQISLSLKEFVMVLNIWLFLTHYKRVMCSLNYEL